MIASPWRPWHRVALAAGAVAWLSGGSCLHVQRPYPAPSADTVVAALASRAAAVRSLRAEARVTHVSSQGKVRATVRMMAQRGGKLRLDMVSPFDTPVATLVASEGKFALVDARENRHYHGPASPCNLARILRVQLPPEEVLTILSGATPLIAHDRRELSWDGRDAVEVLTLRGDRLVQQVRLAGAPNRWELQSSEVRDRTGAVLLRIVATDYHKVSSMRLPRRIDISQPKYEAAMRLTYRKQSINIDLPDVAFQRPAADGLPSRHVTCGDSPRGRHMGVNTGSAN